IAIGGKNQLPLKGFKGKRVSGKDRYETALEIAKLSFDKNNNAILASGEVFADSLSAVSLTKKHNAPIILTQSNSLTENAKKYLNGKNVFIVGGEKTVVNKIMTNITTEERAKIASFNLEEEIEKVLAKKKNNDNINLEKEIERILAKNQAYQNLIIKQEVEKALSGKQIGKSTNLEKEIEKILDKKQSNQNIDLEKEIEKIIDKKLSDKNNNLEKEIEKILDKKKSNQVIDLEKEIERILDKRKAEEDEKNSRVNKALQELDSVKWSLDIAKTNLEGLKSRLRRYENPDNGEDNIEYEIKRIQRDIKEHEERNKERIDYNKNRIEEIDKAIPLINKRIEEGAFAFFEWAGEKYPKYKQDADKALDILNEYYKKGYIKKILGDATSYENLMASADLFKQLEDFQIKTRSGYYGTNFSILAKAMVSCNRNVYSLNTNKNTSVILEYLYSGEKNPIEYWYYDGKSVYDELVKTIKEKYVYENTEVAMNKAKEDYKKVHGKEPDFGYFGDLLEYAVDIAAIARNSSVGSNNTFCLNGEKINRFGTVVGNFDDIIREYKKFINKEDLLNEKTRAQSVIAEFEQYKKNRENDIERLKNEKKDGLAKLKEEIKETEKEVARLEKEYKEKKEAYDKLK
ncbi:cell wall-binding repeat-containing protein, partial [Finegoldia magna]|uniref:cell wall-binding repeat-containing protein n=1 Tax=Finegoldia magna TaxID=1260 RepID=UPI0037C1B2E6